MSHTVKIQAKFKTEQLEAFKRALSVFGWTTKEKSQIRTYPGDSARSTVYDLIAVNPNSGYDLGLVFNDKTGELEVMGDFYDGSISKTLGSGIDNLKQEYSLAVIEDKFAFDGYVTSREVEQDGAISIYGEKNA
jgi:hypothetical protein